MEVKLLVRPSEITQFTPMGGNVDVDKYKYCIYDAQVMVIEPLLGTELYNKILAGIQPNSTDLQGKYLELYNDYLKPILRHQVFAEYVETGSYVVANGGIFKNAPANTEVVGKNEVQYLANTHRSKAQTYIDRAKNWLGTSGIPEYKNRGCGGSNVRVGSGWFI